MKSISDFTPPEIIDLINNIENRFPVNQWQIDGIHIWPILRIALSHELISRLFLEKGEEGKFFHFIQTFKRSKHILNRLLKTYFGYLKSYVLDYKNNAKNDISAKAIFLSDGVSYTLINGTKYQRFCEPMMDYLESRDISCFLLSQGNFYFIPRHRPSQFIQPRLDWILIKNKFSRSPIRTFEEFPDLHKMFTYIQRKVPSSNLSPAYLSRAIDLVKEYSHYFESHFNRVKPVWGFLTNYYNFQGLGFILACSRHNIPSIDIQHGLQGRMHRAYGRWNKVPKSGFDLLPSKFWVWGEEEAEAINQWASQCPGFHSPIVGGNLFLNMWQTGKVQASGVITDKIIGIIEKHLNAKHIIVTLQSKNQLSKKVQANLISAIEKTESTMFWWLRMHPTFPQENIWFKDLFARYPNVDLDLATQSPLYALLPHMDVNITHSSSTVLEAEQFGIKSVVYSKYGAHFLSDKIKSKVAVLAENCEGILESIQHQIARKEPANYIAKEAEIRLNNAYEALFE